MVGPIFTKEESLIQDEKPATQGQQVLRSLGLEPTKDPVLPLPGNRGGRSCWREGRRDRERATSQQRALTTAGDFFLQRAHSQHLFLITPPPLAEKGGAASLQQRRRQQRLRHHHWYRDGRGSWALCSVWAGGDRCLALLGSRLEPDRKET